MPQYAATLAEEASIHLRGREIPRFLQGQLTCDLRRLAADRAIPGAMCNLKGRVISDLWVLPVDEGHCILRLRRSIAEDFALNLERYARFSRIAVEVDPRPGAIGGVYGELQEGDTGLPADVGALVRRDTLLWLRSGPQQLQCIDTATDGEARPADVSASAAAGDAGHWQAETLCAGHYAIERADSERFTPQALNYDESGRVAFDKGCYTGQEVVARLHYRGQSKKRLAVLAAAAEESVAAGDRLYDDGGNAAGECLRSEPDRRGRLIVAALVDAKHRGTPLVLENGSDLSPL